MNGYCFAAVASFGTYTAVNNRTPSRIGIWYSNFVKCARMKVWRASGLAGDAAGGVIGGVSITVIACIAAGSGTAS